MSNKRLAIVLTAVLSPLLVPVLAHAQSGQNGSIVGYVFDEGGMPLKGIKISATSPTQIGGERVAYSSDEGSFRLPALQPGDFDVRASAPKLETIILKGVKVGISGAAEINVVMKVQTKTEEIAVVEKAPLVITTKSNVTEVFDLEMVENLPHGSRDNVHSQVVNDVAGGMNGRIRGGATRQTIFSQDGFEMRGQFPTLKSSAAYEVNTGGYGVDNPMAAGGTVNLVTKSGSNKFEFEFNAVADSNRAAVLPGRAGQPGADVQLLRQPDGLGANHQGQALVSLQHGVAHPDDEPGSGRRGVLPESGDVPEVHPEGDVEADLAGDQPEQAADADELRYAARVESARRSGHRAGGAGDPTRVPVHAGADLGVVAVGLAGASLAGGVHDSDLGARVPAAVWHAAGGVQPHPGGQEHLPADAGVREQPGESAAGSIQHPVPEPAGVVRELEGAGGSRDPAEGQLLRRAGHPEILAAG